MQEDKKIEEYIIGNDLEKKEKWNWMEKLSHFLNSRYFAAVAVILLAITAFCLGRISGLREKREPVRVINSNTDQLELGEVKGAATNSSGQVVASKSGTKYHYPWCAGAKQISEKNKITFDSIEAARAAGYTPATNCKGLK